MARQSSFSSRASRCALPASDAPQWEVISPGLRLGYRRGRGTQGRGGTWLAAGRGADGDRKQVKLGRADDLLPADGKRVLSCEQAKDAARLWLKKLRAGGPTAAGLTVAGVLDQYFDARAASGMKSIYDAKSRAGVHILPKLGKSLVAELTVDQVRKWRDSMVAAPKTLRTGKFATKTNTRTVDLSDPETARRRRDTANRTLTTLKAALNWAFDHRLVDDDSAWRLVKPYRSTTSSRIRFLTSAEQQVLVDNAEGELRDLIAAALMTGARFGELARLSVRDFDPVNASVFIAESKSGKARHIPLTAGCVALFTRLSADRDRTDPLLRHVDGRWKPAAYHREFKAAVARAELNDITLHELRHSYASTMVRAGAPLIVVAEALGHSGTRMVEMHYAHLAPSYVADTIRRTAPDLTENANEKSKQGNEITVQGGGRSAG